MYIWIFEVTNGEQETFNQKQRNEWEHVFVYHHGGLTCGNGFW